MYCMYVDVIPPPPLLQAYRLEPLINPLYAQIKPVRIDSGNKISKEAVDHAEGPKTKPPLQTSQGKSWFSALSIFSSGTGTSSPKKTSPEPGRAKSAEKVSALRLKLCYTICDP